MMILLTLSDRASIDGYRTSVTTSLYTTSELHVFIQLLMYRINPYSYPICHYLSSYFYIFTRVSIMTIFFLCWSEWLSNYGDMIVSNNPFDTGFFYVFWFFVSPIANIILNLAQYYSITALFHISEKVYNNSRIRIQLSKNIRIQELYDTYIKYDIDDNNIDEWSIEELTAFWDDYSEDITISNNKIMQFLFDTLVHLQFQLREKSRRNINSNSPYYQTPTPVEKSNNTNTNGKLADFGKIGTFCGCVCARKKKINVKQEPRRGKEMKGIRWQTIHYLFNNELLFANDNISTQQIIQEKVRLLNASALRVFRKNYSGIQQVVSGDDDKNGDGNGNGNGNDINTSTNSIKITVNHIEMPKRNKNNNNNKKENEEKNHKNNTENKNNKNNISNLSVNTKLKQSSLSVTRLPQLNRVRSVRRGSIYIVTGEMQHKIRKFAQSIERFNESAIENLAYISNKNHSSARERLLKNINNQIDLSKNEAKYNCHYWILTILRCIPCRYGCNMEKIIENKQDVDKLIQIERKIRENNHDTKLAIRIETKEFEIEQKKKELEKQKQKQKKIGRNTKLKQKKNKNKNKNKSKNNSKNRVSSVTISKREKGYTGTAMPSPHDNDENDDNRDNDNNGDNGMDDNGMDDNGMDDIVENDGSPDSTNSTNSKTGTNDSQELALLIHNHSSRDSRCNIELEDDTDCDDIIDHNDIDAAVAAARGTDGRAVFDYDNDNDDNDDDSDSDSGDDVKGDDDENGENGTMLDHPDLSQIRARRSSDSNTILGVRQKSSSAGSREERINGVPISLKKSNTSQSLIGSDEAIGYFENLT